MKDLVKARLKSSTKRKRRKPSFRLVTCLSVLRYGISIFVVLRHQRLYLSSMATPQLGLNKILSSRPSAILASVYLRRLYRALTRFNFSPGCGISLTGGYGEFIIRNSLIDRLSEKAWQNGSETPKLGTRKILQCSKAFYIWSRQTLYECLMPYWSQLLFMWFLSHR